MLIRRAGEEDIGGILELLSQVLKVHADIRPDLFIPDRTKYTALELEEILRDDNRPVFVAIRDDKVAGYAFCILKDEPLTNVTYAQRELYLDDLCVDAAYRGTDVAADIFRYVKEEASKRGCSFLTLNVWEGNIAAERFYEKMGMSPRKTMMEIML